MIGHFSTPRPTTDRFLLPAVICCRLLLSASGFVVTSLPPVGATALGLGAARNQPSAYPARTWTMKADRLVVWFRNDLRVMDNYVIAEATKQLESNRDLELVPVYCFDPRHFARSEYGPLKTGVRRARFMLEAVHDLRSRLRSIGSDLLVMHGRPEDVMPTLMRAGGATTVLAQEEVTWEELKVNQGVKNSIEQHGGKLELVWGTTLYHRADLPFDDKLQDMPDLMTPFLKSVEANCQILPLVPSPAFLPALPSGLPNNYTPSLHQLGFSDDDIERDSRVDERGVMVFVGGETEGLKRIQDYFFDKDCLKDYFDTRNGMIGPNYSSKFSPWLSLGCISPRFIYQEAKRYELVRDIANKSTYWMVWEITVRDFFRFLCLKYGNTIFKLEGMAQRDWKWSRDETLLQRWKDGMTGLPLVDANMRELKLTGYISNRGRQNVASYLTQNLNVDWRLGAAYFEELLIDHDVTQNWGNWNNAGGVSKGRVNRFNILKQSRDYDADGEYVRLWLPCLSKVPAASVHCPWTLSEEEQADYGVKLMELTEEGYDDRTCYPLPIAEPQTRRQRRGDEGKGRAPPEG